MKRERLEIAAVLPVPADRLYRAWLDSREHTAMTGSAASISARVGGRMRAWAGYIEGEILELDPGKRIVVAWRTTDFSARDPDSRLEIAFEPRGARTRMVLRHVDLPCGGAATYRKGWRTFYLAPMRKHFAITPAAPPRSTRASRAKPGSRRTSAAKPRRS